MNKTELKDEFFKDFKKVKTSLLDIIDNNRNISAEMVEALIDGDFSSLEEYNIITKGILEASKNITEIYAQVPKILGEVDKNIKEPKKSLSVEDLLKEGKDE